MKDCKRVKGMLAASLYEALPSGEAKTLDRHVSVCTECRAELLNLRQLTACPPEEVPAFQGDLLPVLRERIRATKGARLRWAWAASTVAFAVLAVALGTVYLPPSVSPSGPDAVRQTPVSALASTLDRATALEEEGNLPAARDALAQALETGTNDPLAGDAWLTLARVQYDLGHFDASLNAYEAIRSDHPGAWRDSAPGAKVRYELLADTRKEGFQPLIVLERARRKGESAFGELERIVAQRPESVVAREALTAMCAALGDQDAGVSTVAALENVRKRCTDPTALARVDLEMGHAYWRDLDDPQRARAHFTVAAEAKNEVLARLANEALSALDAPPGP